MPVAVNCCVAPNKIDGFAGATAIETRVGAPTVRVVEPVIEPEAARIAVAPCAALVARPVLLIVATLIADEPHVAEAVKSCVLPSV